MRTLTIVGSIAAVATTVGLLTAAPAALPFQFDTPPTPPCGTVFTVEAGETVTFPVQITDHNTTDLVIMRFTSPPPAGSTTSPQVPLTGITTAATTFSWTPTADQVGSHTVGFGGLNVGGLRIFCSFTIIVNPPTSDDFCTYTQGGWGSTPSGSNPGALLASVFGLVFPGGIEVGIPGAGGFSLTFTSADAISDYLPAGGTPRALTADATNPASSKGAFSGQVLALKLNVSLAAAGVLPGEGNTGDLVLCNTGNAALDGETVAEVLAAAEIALGGGGLPYGFTSMASLNELVTNLNESFDNCSQNDWASAHLCH